VERNKFRKFRARLDISVLGSFRLDISVMGSFRLDISVLGSLRLDISGMGGFRLDIPFWEAVILIPNPRPRLSTLVSFFRSDVAFVLNLATVFTYVHTVQPLFSPPF
jgi:hypothetical protein